MTEVASVELALLMWNLQGRLTTTKEKYEEPRVGESAHAHLAVLPPTSPSSIPSSEPLPSKHTRFNSAGLNLVEEGTTD